MDHLRACPHCPKYKDPGGCHIYGDITWVNRRGGCPGFPYREIPRSRGEYVNGEIVSGSQRPGQQKQKVNDKTYNNAKSKRKYG
jgi:hypothetical protein